MNLINFLFLLLIITLSLSMIKIWDFEINKLFTIATLIIMSISTSILSEISFAYSVRFLVKVLYGSLFIGLGVYLKILTVENMFLIFKRE